MLLLLACSDKGTEPEVFDAAKVCPESGRGTFVDERDGQVYKYTTIGNQVWMAQNMNFYIDGVEVVEPSTGKTEKASSSCDSEEDNCAENGWSYNWYAANYACPTGWHLPSQEEWETLIKKMGGDCARLRSTTGGWKELNRGEGVSATDDCGFDLKPSSGRYDGGFSANMWAQNVDQENVIYVQIKSYAQEIEFSRYRRDLRFASIRCLKNK
ncbi:FISUMP domain-containing protein [Fibrobacter intestinalis]|uniref:Major paralogous domain-containing protein n=1 Tax=Fibrobacter intestinalis TaxID=28122 RepID=A0A1T4M7F8_9BACT|nr:MULTISPECIES: FISUMP domain-containing protein [Fibrobacter]PBC73595.1 uncharacterized protein (TIGR02145 family) [Fibrobacter sp. NR9]SJZ62939.1 major paralogous domain-containing protein [Fibrobacter intestinalis]